MNKKINYFKNIIFKNRLNSFKETVSKFFILFLIIIGTVVHAQENEFSKNVNTYKKNDIYTKDYDTSKFRLGILNANYSDGAPTLSRVPSSYFSIQQKLTETPSHLCEVVKSKRGLAFADSPAYVVSALKKAGAIATTDKNFSLNSGHFFWELYLSYRDFVDISQPIKREGTFSLSKLPDGAIITLEKGCNPNGLAAIHCNGKYYTPKFVDTQKLEQRLNDPSDESCKVGKGFRVIAESKRFL